jgi:uncharacterized membrane protein
MFGLTPLGIVHTLISLVAVAAGLATLVRDRAITHRNRLGRLYVWTTALTCLTGFPIMQHGGFGIAHALGVVTLIALVVAWGADRFRWFGRLSPYVEVVTYSATFCFHLIPAVVETTTRLPLGKPLIADRDGPELQAVTGGLLLLLALGAAFQVRSLRRRSQEALIP